MVAMTATVVVLLAVVRAVTALLPDRSPPPPITACFVFCPARTCK